MNPPLPHHGPLGIALLAMFLLLSPFPAGAQNDVIANEPEEREAPGDGVSDTSPRILTKNREDVTEQVSRHILKLAADEREKRMDFMGVVIEDVARLCDLDEAQGERLLLAAKGATERSMTKWHEQAERYFRSRLSGSDEETAREILDNMGNVNFGGRDAEKTGESEELWKETLSAVLSPDQVLRYEEVLEQRRVARIQAFAAISLTSIDSHLRLTPNQREKLRILIDESAEIYLDEVQRYWGDYYERGMLMSLANASPDEALKKILTADQFRRLKSATASYDHFWDRERRDRLNREKAAAMREAKKEEADEESN